MTARPLNFDLERARRAVVPLTTIGATGASQLRLGGGSATLIDVRADRDGEPVGLWLTAAHVLEASSNWGLVDFFDSDGRAPRHEIAWTLARFAPGDVAAIFARFPSPSDVARPFRIATRRPEPGTLLYGAGWGEPELGDRFALTPGRAFSPPPANEGGGIAGLQNASVGDVDAPHWGWVAALARPGDSGGPILDANGALVGIRSGGIAASTNERDVRGSRFGRYFSTVGAEFVAAVRSSFASKIAAKPYLFD